MEALIGFGLMMAWTIIAIRHGWAGLWWLSFAGLLVAIGGAVAAALCVVVLAFYLLVQESAERKDTS